MQVKNNAEGAGDTGRGKDVISPEVGWDMLLETPRVFLDSFLFLVTLREKPVYQTDFQFFLQNGGSLRFPGVILVSMHQPIPLFVSRPPNSLKIMQV